ncbi:MAG: M48 family metallopeptidase [Clostridiales bacterium]|nr:M48 family metallopeptidase [Clostridiales bacterium]
MANNNRTLSLSSGIIYTIVHSNRRTVAIEVKPSGEVTVRAPAHMPYATARAFAESKAEWIEKALEKVETQRREREATMPPPFTGADGDVLLFLGKTLTAKRIAGASSPHIEGGFLILPAEIELPGIINWLREQAADEINARLLKYGELLGVTWKSVRLSDARTRWGMCSGKNSINLSWRLIFCIPEAIDYVVAHELCHIKHKNHKAEFYDELERVFPERRRVEHWLKEHSMLINYL